MDKHEMKIDSKDCPPLCMTGIESMTDEYIQFWSNIYNWTVRYYPSGEVKEFKNGVEVSFYWLENIPEGSDLRQQAEYLRKVWQLHHD